MCDNKDHWRHPLFVHAWDWHCQEANRCERASETSERRYRPVSVTYCNVLQCFSANAAAAAGAIIYILLYMPYFFLSFRMDSLSYQTKMALSLDMNLAMSFGCVIMAQYEDM